MNRDILYSELKPSIELQNYIKTYWYYENRSSDNMNYTILPDACFDILFYFSVNGFEKVYITGLWMKPVDVCMDKGVRVLAIRFKPMAAECIFNESLAEVINSSFDGKELINRIGVDIQDISSIEDLRNITHKRMSYIAKNAVRDSRKMKLFDCIEKYKGNVSVGILSDYSGWSSRQINRYFNKWFGINLKQYCSIYMIKQCYHMLNRNKFLPPEGYYDQSHYIRNIKKFTGATPKQIISDTDGRFFQVETEQQ